MMEQILTHGAHALLHVNIAPSPTSRSTYLETLLNLDFYLLFFTSRTTARVILLYSA